MLNRSEVLLKTKVDTGCGQESRAPSTQSEEYDQVQWSTKMLVETGRFLFLFTGHSKRDIYALSICSQCDVSKHGPCETSRVSGYVG